MKAMAARAFLLTASVLFSLLLGEALLRLALDEINYLRPTLQPHPVLGHAIVPGSGGHDLWGFRNRAVPKRVDILAIGDSQTYGVSATLDESYPSWLQRLSGKSVYNLALGGYGPPDYHYLLLERGVSLSPEIAIIGFYFGNDLPRADGSGPSVDESIEPVVDLSGVRDRRALAGLRSWLSRNSLLYQVIKVGFAPPKHRTGQQKRRSPPPRGVGPRAEGHLQ